MASLIDTQALRTYVDKAIASLPIEKAEKLLRETPSYQLGLAAGVSYLLVVRLLRYGRRNAIQRESKYKTRGDYSKMTANEAQALMRKVFECEFPFMGEKALQFALFRTYGIPTISKLLVKTKQLSNPEYAPRRLVDTVVLIGEFLGAPPDSDRANSAIARMNYLHSLYQASGQISNDDLLYTLSLFATEPVAWINRFEWRQITPLENNAIGTFWKSVGDAMGISYEDLPSYKTGWRDGLDFFDEIKQWAIGYENRVMVPTADNHQTAVETTKMLLYDVPKPLHPLGEQVVSSLMDEKLREAMIYPKPPGWFQSAVLGSLHIRKYVIRYLMLPRPYAWRANLLTEEPNEFGKRNVIYYDAEPWYVRDSFYNRWVSPQTWRKWMMGLPIPGKQFKPEGYDITQVGPKRLEGKGMKEWNETRTKLLSQNRGGCPFG